MKLIQQSKLFFREGNSDKVYEIDLCELSPESYIVNFRYGRRGAVLKEGTKTPEALSREKAESVFAALESEKKKKGYQTEVETFIELPSLEQVEPRSVQGVILQRLNDAVEGRNSFRTEWKTSRVIWRAGYLQILEAIPFIIKLASKGDEMQLYASLWALTQLKAAQAAGLFNSFAFQPKQKPYLRNIACEGLLNILEGEKLAQLDEHLLGKLPPEIRYDIETGNLETLASNLEKDSNNQKVSYFAEIYLLCKARTALLSVLNKAMSDWPFRPPYFQVIRSIYKLAQTRNDMVTLAALTYRFEKEKAMFSRRASLDDDSRQMIELPEGIAPVRVGKELKSKDSRIAFSQFTKAYFQKNSVQHLRNLGKDAGAKDYLKLAVATLLQYSEADYTPAEKRPLSLYGSYNYNNKTYSHTLVDYPECAGSLLLTMILSGNDPKRLLQPNLKFIYGQEIVTSTSYYYSPDKVRTKTPVAQPQQQNIAKPESNSLGAAINVLKGLFGKKAEPEKVETPASQPKTSPVAETVTVSNRTELFPEHWDAMPEAYVQLLMQAQMNLIHRFAYDSLRKHNNYDTICRRFDENAILRLLSSNFAIPNQLGFETLESRKEEFYRNATFMAHVLDANSVPARAWVRAIVNSNPNDYTGDLDFIFSLLFNVRNDNHQWIDALLGSVTFPGERMQVLVGKAVAEMLSWENTPDNNHNAEFVINRLHQFAPQQITQISWSIVEQLIASPLEANTLLAGKVVVQRSQQVNPTEIPFSLTALFLGNGIPAIRQSGMELAKRYPDSYLAENPDFVLAQTDSSYRDVAESFLERIRNMVRQYPKMGDNAVHYLVYVMIRKEKFEGAHQLVSRFVLNDLKFFHETGLTPKDITKLVHASYRESQLSGYDLLKTFRRSGDFTIGQIVSFASHELLAVRQWCWNYFTQNIARIRYERDKALAILDAKWDDSRAFAFHFFKTSFIAADWDADTLIGIVDSIRPDVEKFGKELIMLHFDPANAQEYLTKLSEHPSANVQLLVSSYLSQYVTGNTAMLEGLGYYFRSTLMRVNKGRVAKDRIFRFLHQEAVKSPEAAAMIVPLLDDVSAQATVRDKATCIHILTEIKTHYPHLDMHLMIQN